MRHIIILFCLFFVSIFGYSQDIPNTNIYLFEIDQATDSLFKFTNPKLLTFFNHSGYNNQPYFFSDNELYFSVRFPNETQTDIYSLDLVNGTKTQVTATIESEYSPVRMPDFYNFSAVRVEKDENESQRLWQFPVDRTTNGKPVFKYIKNIGYHHWLSGYKVALFLTGEPNTLVIADTRTDKTIHQTSNIGRCFQTLPNGNLAYVHKRSEQTWYLMELNTYNNRSEIITSTLPGCEDFTIMPDGTILMASDSKLFKFNKMIDNYWLEIADLKYYNIRNINRMTVSKDNKIALVAN
ncbi:MAG: hypothetical protein GY705_16580 [Bacteroidetes bacterium]|nr:hypothetical protein [Bacteroidota bacterium]